MSFLLVATLGFGCDEFMEDAPDLEARVKRLEAELAMLTQGNASLAEILKAHRRTDLALQGKLLALQSLVVDLGESLGIPEQQLIEALERKRRWFVDRHLRDVEKHAQEQKPELLGPLSEQDQRALEDVSEDDECPPLFG